MKPEEFLRKYLRQANAMQLATSVDDQPWICTLHFHADENFNIYWISTPDRRHSREIARNPKVSAAIVVHENTPEEDYVIGVSIVGTAELEGDQVEAAIGEGFLSKHGKDPELLSDIKSGSNPHQFYRLRPTQIVLFDSKNFPDNPRQEIVI